MISPKSQRGGIAFTMLVAIFLIGVATLVFAFAFAHTLSTTVAVTGMWFGGSLITLTSWRFVMRQFLFKVRRSGLNSRSAIIIGATEAGYNMAVQMMENDQLGIRFEGVYDDRPQDRVTGEFRNQIKGSIDEAIELAKTHKVDYIYIALPTAAEDRIKAILE
ncbi:MAG: undecaprenyl-phosphate glucose phosphotransferase, partial [Proteobacteria bacterium]|nr:undecaprenyl-phosphate glucose phosphotransferase [Pseudomonadota bacterium]